MFLIDNLENIINRLDNSGYSMLHHSITYNNLEIFKYLI